MFPHIQNFFINYQITHIFVHLAACVFHGHDLTTPTSYFLIPARIFFLVTHLIKVPTKVLISSPSNSLFLVIFNLMSHLSPLLLPLILPYVSFLTFPHWFALALPVGHISFQAATMPPPLAVTFSLFFSCQGSKHWGGTSSRPE